MVVVVYCINCCSDEANNQPYRGKRGRQALMCVNKGLASIDKEQILKQRGVCWLPTYKKISDEEYIPTWDHKDDQAQIKRQGVVSFNH
jgi:hypothetical protein